MRFGELSAWWRRRHYRRIRRDPLRDYAWALVNIKTLGYELARLTAAAAPPVAPAEPPATALLSKPCTQADIESAWVAFWCAQVGVRPIYHRKVWELCYIAQALYEAGMLRPGRSGLGFGCGREPLPSLFARYGCTVLATDLAPAAARAGKWIDTRQHAVGVDTVRNAEICPDPAKLQNIAFRFVDMRHIPRDLDGAFDFCWSSCALEHLGSIAAGAAFIENSLRALKPGGVAVHTTEFNLSETGDTLDYGDPVLFQRRHIEAIAAHLTAQGNPIAPLDFDAGCGALDRYVDLPPWDPDLHCTSAPPPHLKASVWGYRCTSFALIVRRGG
ncbi:MAG: class I SAM-dependent methyltransferase [Alphaproteobacteria bacterium]|nr:class I SAM-dependent methyltransferase [Alphaproteobacteria bacterium]MBV9863168.1 class I SAM-dependent methyltransferase [Alphaproteobacteria bacterium]